MFWILILCFKILVCIKWLFLIFVTFVWSLFVSYDTISLSFKTSLPLVPDLSRQSHLKTFHTFVQNFLHYPPKWKKLIYLRIGTWNYFKSFLIIEPLPFSKYGVITATLLSVFPPLKPRRSQPRTFDLYFSTEITLLSNNVNDYHFVSQGKTSIPGVDDGEEFHITDVSFVTSVIHILNSPLHHERLNFTISCRIIIFWFTS